MHEKMLFDMLNNRLFFEGVHNQCVVLGHFVSSLVSYPRCHGFGLIGSHMFSVAYFSTFGSIVQLGSWHLVCYILVGLQPGPFQAQSLGFRVPFYLCYICLKNR